MPKHEPTWPALVCTRCGGWLFVELTDEGTLWQSYRVVDSIECEKCGASWDHDGRPKATEWLAEIEEPEG